MEMLKALIFSSCLLLRSTAGCPDGLWGENCEDRCPLTCVRCTVTTSTTCSKCVDGFYNGKLYDQISQPYISDCSLACRDHCRSCSLYNNCSACTAGYYSEQWLCHECSKYCLHCENENTCKQCTPNYFVSVDNRCDACLPNCKFCLDRTGCDECVEGYYGNQCMDQCSKGCEDGLCDQTTGNCLCKSRFIGTKCDKCVSGNYGELCSNTCSTGCESHVCEKNNGRCTCHANFTGSMCDDCTDGNYGKDCDKLCNQKCQNTRCNRVTGECNQASGCECEECNTGGYIAAICFAALFGLTTVVLFVCLCRNISLKTRVMRAFSAITANVLITEPEIEHPLPPFNQQRQLPLDQVTNQDSECSICFDREINAALIPCGHSFCYECCVQIQFDAQPCPTCRQPIDRIQHVYR